MFQFDLNGKEYSLDFNMGAVQFYSKSLAEEMIRLSGVTDETPEKDRKKIILNSVNQISGFKGFLFVVHAGMYGYADIERLKIPTYKEAYQLTEEILLQGEGLQGRIMDAYVNSRATQDQLNKLGLQKKSPEVKKKSIGTQKKATPIQS